MKRLKERRWQSVLMSGIGVEGVVWKQVEQGGRNDSKKRWDRYGMVWIGG